MCKTRDYVLMKSPIKSCPASSMPGITDAMYGNRKHPIQTRIGCQAIPEGVTPMTKNITPARISRTAPNRRKIERNPVAIKHSHLSRNRINHIGDRMIFTIILMTFFLLQTIVVRLQYCWIRLAAHHLSINAHTKR